MRNNRIFSFAAIVLLFAPHPSATTNSIWTDILACVQDFVNQTDVPTDHTELQERLQVNDSDLENTENNTGSYPSGMQRFSMLGLSSIICGNKVEFVKCLDSGLRRSEDLTAHLISSNFDPGLVTKAYEGLCANISEIESEDTNVMNCLTNVKVTSCHNEMADYFFYMEIIKEFAPPSEQLPRSTLETLLCSVMSRRRKCEIESLRSCSSELADAMSDFYTQTSPISCMDKDGTETR